MTSQLHLEAASCSVVDSHQLDADPDSTDHPDADPDGDPDSDIIFLYGSGSEFSP